MMIITEITILVNRKPDIDRVKEKIIESNFWFPVYLLELENHFRIDFTSDYPQWELDTAILNAFPDYEFTSSVGNGRKEIRLQISRYQPPNSTDDWGRPIENPLDETKYLIKKSKDEEPKFSPNVKVLFEADEVDYHINIVHGIQRESERTPERKGFLVLDEFRTDQPNEGTDFFKDKLHDKPIDAFYAGYWKMQELVDQDFKQYQEDKKKEIRRQQKLPRKIIRAFIKAANDSNIEGLLENLDDSVVFKKMKGFQLEFEVKGKEKFKEYLESSDQDFCGKELKIRSSWSFKEPMIEIGVKYYPEEIQDEDRTLGKLKYRQIRFEMIENRVYSITEITRFD